MPRLNATGSLCYVTALVEDASGAYVETLSCGHMQFAAPHAAKRVHSGEISTTVGQDRKCWTCKSR